MLLAEPAALADDVLESCLYILRERLRAVPPREPARPGRANPAL